MSKQTGVAISVEEAAKSFKKLLTTKQRFRTMVNVKMAGAREIHDLVKRPGYGFKDGKPRLVMRGKKAGKMVGGTLRKRLKRRKDGIDKQRAGWVAVISPAPHSWLVEYGHGGQRSPAAPHPFLTKAAKQAGPAAVKAMADKFSDEVQKKLKK